MGEFIIDSFEPNLKNNIRVCESIRMNSWMNEWEQKASTDQKQIGKPAVNIWPAGISDKAGNYKFFESYGNPGGGRFVDSMHNRTDFTTLPVTTLDAFAEEMGWFTSKPEIAILQMDVEEYDPNVLVGAQKLLKAGLVKNIFTEVRIKERERRSVEIAAHELLVQAGYKLKGQGGWSGPGKDSLWPNDAKLIETIFDYMEKENKETLKLWWGL
jgi:FkbM family methyltransferase